MHWPLVEGGILYKASVTTFVLRMASMKMKWVVRIGGSIGE